jgi:hypothetical protein
LVETPSGLPDNLGKILKALKWKNWHILWPFVNLETIWYIFPRFGPLSQEKSGNPEHHPHPSALSGPSASDHCVRSS